MEPVAARYRNRDFPRYFRADAAFAQPQLYEYLEAEGYGYASAFLPMRCCRGRSGLC